MRIVLHVADRLIAGRTRHDSEESLQDSDEKVKPDPRSVH
jgi:hypothetical protein